MISAARIAHFICYTNVASSVPLSALENGAASCCDKPVIPFQTYQLNCCERWIHERCLMSWYSETNKCRFCNVRNLAIGPFGHDTAKEYMNPDFCDPQLVAIAGGILGLLFLHTFRLL